MKTWFKSGEPFIWLNAGAVTISFVMVAGLLCLIAWRGLGHFWPKDVAAIEYAPANGARLSLLGEIADEESIRARQFEIGRETEVAQNDERVTRYLLQTGNRKISGLDFRWIAETAIETVRYPDNATVVERLEWGNFYGYPQAVLQAGQPVAGEDGLWETLENRLARAHAIREQIDEIESGRISAINYELNNLRLDERGLELENEATPRALAAIDAQRAELKAEYRLIIERLDALYEQAARDSLRMVSSDGTVATIPLSQIVRVTQPNRMGLWDKLGYYVEKLWAFVSKKPREANTEGGIFPAIFGTVLMVLLMSVFVTPFGVIAAIYLHEYAKQGPLTRTIRVAVNNLAGVPSIVYGVFGLGFFIYVLGGSIDQLFFEAALPAPTFGTGGLFWASLTLALLTLPVVIVSTEEGLARIPRAIREGSLALGATKAETLWRTVLPMASPAMITGVILAVARAAGEVAPLMLVGVVKLAPSLPLDGNFPYLHLERKFMHLGFHIYDVGFQSPNVEASRPIVYATALLLVIIIIVLNLMAIRIRNRLREKYRAFEA